MQIHWRTIIRRPEIKKAFIIAVIVAASSLFFNAGWYAPVLFAAVFILLAPLLFFSQRRVGRRKWLTQHLRFIAQARSGGSKLLFIGDSLTQDWDRTVWDKYFKPLNAANFGIAGDTTHQILWRLQNGELDSVTTKVIVIMAGTNNVSYGETPEQIAGSINEIVTFIQDKLHFVTILLIGILPAGKLPQSSRRKTIRDANTMLSAMKKDRLVFLDIGEKFLDGQGNVSPLLMPDYQHLSKAGYAVYSNAVQSTINEFLQE